jgi:hypothetical protein
VSAAPPVLVLVSVDLHFTNVSMVSYFPSIAIVTSVMGDNQVCCSVFLKRMFG